MKTAPGRTKRPADKGRTHPLTDESLDRELAAAIDVDPSPEFLARVRMRVADEPTRSPWRARGGLVAVGAALAMMALAVTVPEWSADRIEPSEAIVASAPIAAEPIPSADDRGANLGQPAVAVETDGRAALHGPPDPDVRAQREAVVLPFSDVLISEDERRAFDLLLSTIRADELPSLPASDEGTNTLRPPPLQIMPVVIEPLWQVARLE